MRNNRLVKILANENGYVLVYAVLFLSVILLGSSLLLADLSDQRENSKNEQARIQSQWMADSGWNMAVDSLEQELDREYQNRLERIRMDEEMSGESDEESMSEENRITSEEILMEPFHIEGFADTFSVEEGSAKIQLADSGENRADITSDGFCGDYHAKVTGSVRWEWIPEKGYEIQLEKRGY